MRWLLAVVVVALVVVGWFVWQWDTAAPVVPPGATAAGGGAVAQVADAAAPAADRAPDPAVEAGEQIAVPERELADPAGAPGNVRVVTFEDLQPVADASVWCQRPDLDWSELSREQTAELSRLRGEDEREYWRRTGREVRTRADGSCLVDVGERATPLVVWAGDMYGTGYLRAGEDEPVVVQVRADRTLRLLVVDAAGKPAPDVGVEGVTQDAEQRERRFLFGHSDAEGRLSTPHVQQHAGKQAGSTMRVAARIVGGSGPAVEVDVLDPPEQVVLRLPATGAVRVRLEGADGEPLQASYLQSDKVRLEAFDSEADSQAVRSRLHGQWFEADVDDDAVAVFAHVALGKVVRARYGHSGMSAQAAGPTAAGQRVDVALREGGGDVIVAGIASGPTGEPLRDDAVAVSYRSNRSFAMRDAATDGSGRFRCNVGAGPAGEQAVVTVATTRTAERKLSVVMPERVLQAGTNELGKVTLQPLKPLVAGRIVTHGGVEATQVQLSIEHFKGNWWQQLWNLRPDWQEDGTYEIRGDLPPDTKARLVVGAGAYLPVEPIEFELGAADVDIHLLAAGSATATFLVDEQTPVAQLVFEFEPRQEEDSSDPRARMRKRMRARLSRHFPGEAVDGRLQRSWYGLQPGRYDLSVKTAGSMETLVLLEAFEVEVGPVADPRLQEIDLRGRVRELEIRVSAGDGAPVTDPDAFVIVRNDDREWSGYSLRRGQVAVVTASAVDLLVLAPGHEMASVDTVTASQTIPLRAAGSASLTVEYEQPLPSGLRLTLELVPQLGFDRRTRLSLDTGRGMSLRNFLRQNVTVAAEGATEVPVRWPGAYQVEGLLQGGRRIIRDFEPRELTLTAGSHAELRVGAKGLRAAVEHFGK